MFKKIIKNNFRKKIEKIKNSYELKLKEERNKFISILNHDIKTPILAQIQALELILKSYFGKILPDQKEIISEILNSNYFLIDVISNAIFLANYDNEKPNLNLEKLDVVEQVENCCFLLKSLAQEKQQNIIIKGNKNVKLNADRKLMEKIIINLLSSSLNYGLENTDIEVLIEESEKTVSLSAKNTSVYMSKEKINGLFEDKKTQNDFNQLGMNLNLNLAKRLINAHNWDIIANSKKDNSCEFGFLVKK